jgi:hypothetical protein
MNKDKTFLHKTSLDYSKDKNLPVKYFPTSLPTDEVILKENGVYQRNYGTHTKGDTKYKKVFKYRTVYNNIFDAWKAVAELEPHAKQVSSGLNHSRRDVLVCDIDAEINDPDIIYRLKELHCNYIIRNPKTNHLQVGWKYDKPLLEQYSGKEIHRRNILKINEYVRQQVAKRNKDVNLNKVGDDNYNGWQCKNPYCTDLQLVYMNEESSIPNNLEALNVAKHYSKQSPAIAEQVAETDILDVLSSSLYNINKVTVNSNTSNNSDSSDYYIYTNLRTVIWSYMRTHEHKAPTFDEMWSMAQQLNREAAVKTGKGLQPDSEVKQVVKCTGRWAISHYKNLDTTTNEGHFNRSKAAKYEKAVRAAQSLILWGKVKQESGSTREVAAKLNISNKTVSVMRRKTLEEVLELYNKCQVLANIKKEYENKQKYDKLLEEVQLVYYYVLSSSLYNINKVTVNDNNTENTTNKENGNGNRENHRTETSFKGKVLGSRGRCNTETYQRRLSL